jgi:Ca2+-binding RTX toxin-like protein
MAKIWSNVSYNQSNFNLNIIKIGGSDYKFFDNLNSVITDVTYQDIYTVEYTDNGNLLGVDVAGSAITVSANEKALTGGLVNGFFQVVSDGVDWYDAFGFEGIAVSAVALQKAIDSQSTTDDYKIIAGILSGNDTFNLSSYDDYALGYGGKDKLYGGDGKDSLYGGNGNDTLIGGTGLDSLTGGLGADSLDGGNGNDLLFGDAGIDRLIGGAGADSLTGGADADVFVFNQLKGVDLITDFTSGSDRISLSKVAYAALGAKGVLGLDAFYAAEGATKGHMATDRVIYNTSTGALYYDADGSGAGKAVQIAVLESNPVLDYSDVLIF